ncbi:MAG: histidine phosphatase family protein, partial [Clostridia bacterium]|nr:histidine phosphatase family protein [Clostridia bacterium]
GCALRAMLNYLYEDPSDFWHMHVPYNCAVSIVEGRNGRGRLIGDDVIYYDRSQIVDRYAK